MTTHGRSFHTDNDKVSHQKTEHMQTTSLLYLHNSNISISRALLAIHILYFHFDLIHNVWNASETKQM